MTPSISFTKARLFLRTLQRSPEPVRRRWQRGISAAAFMVVIAGWVVYLNVSLVPSTAPANAVESGPGFFETLGKGFSVFGSTLTEEWARVREWGSTLWGSLDARLSNPSVFMFVREESPFVPLPYEPIPPQTLPING